METITALKMLVEEMHSAAVATIGGDGKPRIRIIDMMLYDGSGVYFLTAKGKHFYRELTEQKYVALTAVSGKKSISLHGKIQNIGKQKLDEIFQKNIYMQSIYPEGTRGQLEVFKIYEALGEYFDISVPSSVVREQFTLGAATSQVVNYNITTACTGCKKCLAACPQKCIDVSKTPAVIVQNHCLHCGACAQVCPISAVTI